MMFSQYLRMCFFFLGISLFYVLTIYFVPVSGQKVDTLLGKSWNASLTKSVDILIGKVKDIENAIEQKVDNPAPNTSRNIEGRMGQ